MGKLFQLVVALGVVPAVTLGAPKPHLGCGSLTINGHADALVPDGACHTVSDGAVPKLDNGLCTCNWYLTDHCEGQPASFGISKSGDIQSAQHPRSYACTAAGSLTNDKAHAAVQVREEGQTGVDGCIPISTCKKPDVCLNGNPRYIYSCWYCCTWKSEAPVAGSQDQSGTLQSRGGIGAIDNRYARSVSATDSTTHFDPSLESRDVLPGSVLFFDQHGYSGTPAWEWSRSFCRGIGDGVGGNVQSMVQFQGAHCSYYTVPGCNIDGLTLRFDSTRHQINFGNTGTFQNIVSFSCSLQLPKSGALAVPEDDNNIASATDANTTSILASSTSDHPSVIPRDGAANSGLKVQMRICSGKLLDGVCSDFQAELVSWPPLCYEISDSQNAQSIEQFVAGYCRIFSGGKCHQPEGQGDSTKTPVMYQHIDGRPAFTGFMCSDLPVKDWENIHTHSRLNTTSAVAITKKDIAIARSDAWKPWDRINMTVCTGQAHSGQCFDFPTQITSWPPTCYQIADPEHAWFIEQSSGGWCRIFSGGACKNPEADGDTHVEGSKAYYNHLNGATWFTGWMCSGVPLSQWLNIHTDADFQVVTLPALVNETGNNSNDSPTVPPTPRSNSMDVPTQSKPHTPVVPITNCHGRAYGHPCFVATPDPIGRGCVALDQVYSLRQDTGGFCAYFTGGDCKDARWIGDTHRYPVVAEYLEIPFGLGGQVTGVLCSTSPKFTGEGEAWETRVDLDNVPVVNDYGSI